MVTLFTRHFSKDLDRITQSSTKADVVEIIDQLEKAKSLSEIGNIKKLKGFSTAYRIRCGDYRIGISVEKNVITFACIAHRKDIYKIFP